MKLKKLACMALGSAAAVSTLPALADVQVSGFLTAGASYTDNEIPFYPAGITDEQPNYLQDTVLGIQLDSELDDLTRFSAQLIAKSDTDNFNTNAEWLYVSRNIGSFTTARIGRLRLPLYMNSQSLYVGASYPWIRPPQEVYGMLVGLSGYNGMDVTFNKDTDLGNFELQLFTGKLDSDIPLDFGGSADASTDQMIGTVLRFSSENLDLHLSYSRMDAKMFIDVPGVAAGAPAGPFTPGFSPLTAQSLTLPTDVEVVDFGVKYSLGKLDLRAEAAERGSDDIGDLTAWYGSIAYTMGSWVPYLVLAQSDSKAVPATSLWYNLAFMNGGAPGVQSLLHDADTITLGLRKNLSPTVSFNAELLNSEAKHGTTGQFKTYVPNAAGDELADTDVNMISIAVNVLY